VGKLLCTRICAILGCNCHSVVPFKHENISSPSSQQTKCDNDASTVTIATTLSVTHTDVCGLGWAPAPGSMASVERRLAGNELHAAVTGEYAGGD